MRILLTAWVVLLALCVGVAHADYDFDGTNDSMTVDNPNVGVTDGWTTCFWYYLDANPSNNEDMIGYGNGPDGAAGRGFVIWLQTDGDLHINNFNGSSAYGGNGTTALTTAAWNHICFQRNGTFDNLFFINATDGLKDDDLAVDAPAAPNSTDEFYIADVFPNYAGPGRSHSDGKYAHVAHWNAVLTGPEIASLADKTACPSDVQSASLQIFVPLMSATPTEVKNGFTVSVQDAPVLTANVPSGLPCQTGASAGAEIFRRRGR